MHRDVQPRFADVPNITSLFGDSPVEPAKLTPALPCNHFWLDAHWSEDATAGEQDECPLLAELAVVLPWLQKHVIMIDDARLFMRPPAPLHRIVPAVHRQQVGQLMQSLL